MEQRLDHRQHQKIVLGVLLFLIAAALFNTGTAISGFVPKHLAAGYEILDIHHISENHLSKQFPGYLSFLSSVFLVLNVDPLTPLHLPLQLVPYVTALFVLLHIITNGNLMIPGLVSGLHVLLPSTSSRRMHLLPHGLGDILFFTLLILILLLMRERSERRLFPLSVVCALSLVYISYNKTAVSLLLLTAIYFVLKLTDYLDGFIERSDSLERGNTATTILLLTILLGINTLHSNFFYYRFIPVLIGGFQGGEAIMRVLYTWLESGSVEAEAISHLLITRPPSLTYIAALRYVIIFTGIATVGTYILYKVRSARKLTVIELFIPAYLGAILVYLILRMFVSSFTVSWFYLPGVLVMAYLYSYLDSRKVRLGMVILFVLLAGTIVGTQIENNRHEAIDRNVDVAYEMERVYEWHSRYAPLDKAPLADEHTRNVMMYRSMITHRTDSYHEATRTYGLLRVSQAAGLTTETDPGDDQYYILNNYQRTMSLQKWRIIQSWDNYEGAIHRNTHTNKIYSEGELWIFAS